MATKAPFVATPCSAPITETLWAFIEQTASDVRFEVFFACAAVAFWIVFRKLLKQHRQAGPVKGNNLFLRVAGGSSAASRAAAGAGSPANDAGHRGRLEPEDVMRSYERARRDSGSFANMSTADLQELFADVFTASIRTGRAKMLPRYLTDQNSHGIVMTTAQLASIIKMCTSKRLFSEAIAAFDAVAAWFKVDDPSIWSCLLFCAVEVGAWKRCEGFYSSLKVLRQLSCEDFVNMVRFCVHVHKQDSGRLTKFLDEIRNYGNKGPDSIAYNRALAVCVSANQLEMAEELLYEMRRKVGMCDVITHNTLMKGYAQAGRIDRCFELQQEMTKAGLEPSEVTFGILLDACINANLLDRAAQVFLDFQASGCPLNAVLYTTLIKGLARGGQYEKAMHVFESMCESNVSPDLVTYSVLIKVHCDAGKTDVALDVMNRMSKWNLQPDEIVFNNLLTGCVANGNCDLGIEVFEDMQKRGIVPSHVTLSILVKLFSKCHEWEKALELLDTAPSKLGLPHEGRLYTQLAQACIRERQGKRMLDVYEVMLTRVTATENMNGRLLSLCATFNMFDTAAQLLDIVLKANGRVSTRDANSVLSSALRKKKAQVVRGIYETMCKHSIPVDTMLRREALSAC